MAAPTVTGRLLFLAAASLLLLLISPRAAAQPWQVCGSTGNYTANSTYQSNLASLAKALPANASRSGSHLFASGSVGAVPDVVYALALCRGDTNATACGSCVATGFQDAQQLCAYDRDAAVFYDACYLRFSNQNFIASATNNGNPIILMNSQNVSAPARAFDAAVAVLLNATGDYAAANSSSLFGTGEEGFDATSDPTIYGLTQCTPDMSPADCRSCLGSIISLMPQYLSGRQGGRIVGMRCNFRYEVYSFFSGAPSLRLPALAPPPAPSPSPFNVTPTATPPEGSGELRAPAFQVRRCSSSSLPPYSPTRGAHEFYLHGVTPADFLKDVSSFVLLVSSRLCGAVISSRATAHCAPFAQSTLA